MEAALERYAERVEEPFPYPVQLRTVCSDEFFAVVYPSEQGITVDASEAVEALLAQTWDKCLELSDQLPSDTQIALLGAADHVVDVGLRWLMQHEINHAAIGHFKLSGASGLVEGRGSQTLNIAKRIQTEGSQIIGITKRDQSLISLCLELQADHDATEIVLGYYSGENHLLFRYYATCIALVIFVIEKVDREAGDEQISHPRASTRLFMLLAFLAELPWIPAYRRAHREELDHIPPEYLPSDAEMKMYSSEVMGPVFSACEIISEAVGLSNIMNELGGADAFFSDIEAAALRGASEPQVFKTPCGKQWAELKPLNQKVLNFLGW